MRENATEKEQNMHVATVAVLIFLLAFAGVSGCRKKSLHDAVRCSGINKIKSMVANGVDVNAVDTSGDTPLHVAAILGRINVAELLIDSGADLEAKDHSGLTPLHWAATNSGRIRGMAQFLISKGADIHAITPEKSTLLHLAAQGGDPNLIEMLIEKGLDINAVDNHRDTPLHICVELAESNQSEIAEILLGAGADVMMENKRHHNPLEGAFIANNCHLGGVLVEAIDLETHDKVGNALIHRAVRKGNLRLVRFLLAKGADVNAKDMFGNTALDVAIRDHQTEIAVLLANHSGHSGKKATSRTPSQLEEELLREIRNVISVGGDINAPIDIDQTFLHKAAQHGYARAAESLLAKGADVDVARNDGATALHIAVRHSHVKVASIMLKHSADKDKIDKPGLAPLHYAMMANSKNLELAELLINAGANVDIVGSQGQTPLHTSIEFSDPESTKLLLDKGADPNARTKNGTMPLHYAAALRRKEIIKLLIEKGAQINAKDDEGRTPLDICTQYAEPSFQEVANILREHGGQSSK